MRTGSARNVRLLIAAWVLRLLAVELASWPFPDVMAQQAAEDGTDAQVMTRGPVHEAFAAPLIHDPKPGPVVAKQPPQTVEELPPDQKPVGANIQWIPGYWQWDEGRKDFLWISGVWRDPPPGRQWIPGYWNQVPGGFQWVPGAWMPTPGADESVTQVAGGADASNSGQPQYLSAPPATLEVGPSSPAPAGEVFWSPGCWTWQGARYLWRPGFWAAVQPGWVWMPAQYVWTPSGYLFVQGYWDLPIASRGLLFAPVYYPQPIYLQPGYVYTPSVTIVSSAFTANLFVQPAYSHYCFGDYYAQSYMSVGIFPWFSMSFATGPAMPRYYDPLFSYYSVVNVRHDPRWVTRVREDYIVRRDNVAMRPPRTLVEQTRIIRTEGPRGGVRERVQVIARPVGDLARHPAGPNPIRLERVDATSRRQWQTRATELSHYREQRVAQEREGARNFAAAAGRPGGNNPPRPMKLAHSPVAARPIPPHEGGQRRTPADRVRRDEGPRAGERREDRPNSLADGKRPGPGSPQTPRQQMGRMPQQGANERPPRAPQQGANERPPRAPQQGANERPPRAPQQGANERPPRAPQQGANERPMNPRPQLGGQQPGMRGNPSQIQERRAPNQGRGDRRIPPPHPTPIQRERRERGKG